MVMADWWLGKHGMGRRRRPWPCREARGGEEEGRQAVPARKNRTERRLRGGGGGFAPKHYGTPKRYGAVRFLG